MDMNHQVEAIREILEADDLVLLLQYGSSVRSDDPNDIDLFAVCDAGFELRRQHLGDLDLITVTVDSLEHYLCRLDPIYCTEPFLTGDVVHGDETLYEYICDRISEADAWEPPNAVTYNLRRAVEQQYHLTEELKAGDISDGAKTLTFAVSYRLFAWWYARHPCQALSYRELLEKTTYETELRTILDPFDRSKNGDDPTESDLMEAVLTWEKLLITESPQSIFSE